MKHLLLFEAFESKNISAIEKFLKQLNKEDAKDFIDTLKNISTHTDIPLSLFKGEYVSAMKAIKYYKEGDKIVKFWFSIKDGLIGTTITQQYNGRLDRDWMTEFVKEFITINVRCNEYLRPLDWNKDTYEDIIESQFALIINLSELQKGLKDIIKKRKENRKGATALSSDEYIRLDNDRRRKDILRKRRGISKDDVLDFMMSLVKKYRCYDPMDIIDCTFELYYRNKIDKDMLEAVMNELEERYGDRMGGFGGRFTSRRFGRFGGYEPWFDPWGDNRRDDYGYDDF